MKIVQIILIFGIIFLYNLIYMFLEQGGMQYPLLKILFEMILIVFLMVLYRYKKEIAGLLKLIDEKQKKIDDYYK